MGDFEPSEISTTSAFDRRLARDQATLISHANVDTCFCILSSESQLKEGSDRDGLTREDMPAGEGVQVCDAVRLRRKKL